MRWERLAKLEIFSPRSTARRVVSAISSTTRAAVAPRDGGGGGAADDELAGGGGGGGRWTLAAGSKPRLRSNRSPSNSGGQEETQERKVLTSRENKAPNILLDIELWGVETLPRSETSSSFVKLVWALSKEGEKG